METLRSSHGWSAATVLALLLVDTVAAQPRRCSERASALWSSSPGAGGGEEWRPDSPTVRHTLAGKAPGSAYC